MEGSAAGTAVRNQEKPDEARSSKTLAPAASAGLMLGALSGCGGSQPAESPSGTAAGTAAEGKACCKGLNECAQKGGCAVEGKNVCAGKNACKHQGGCNHHCPK
jgi:hypothetical protein